MNLFWVILIVTISFIVYVEYSVGGILIRSNSSGGKSLNFSSMFHFMINPLHKSFLWNFRSLDINYPFVILCTIIIYKLFPWSFSFTSFHPFWFRFLMFLMFLRFLGISFTFFFLIISYFSHISDYTSNFSFT